MLSVAKMMILKYSLSELEVDVTKISSKELLKLEEVLTVLSLITIQLSFKKKSSRL
jgi:hypothetical protein